MLQADNVGKLYTKYKMNYEAKFSEAIDTVVLDKFTSLVLDDYYGTDYADVNDQIQSQEKTAQKL